MNVENFCFLISFESKLRCVRIINMSKYQKLFQEMIEGNRELFDSFKEIHEKYVENDVKYQKDFNRHGEKVLEIIRKYELLLTSRSEGGQYGKFSSNLADKFMEQVRSVFPRIDFIGVKID